MSNQLNDIKATLNTAGIEFADVRATGPHHYEVTPAVQNNEGEICRCLIDAGFSTSIYPSSSQPTNMVSVLGR